MYVFLGFCLVFSISCYNVMIISLSLALAKMANKFGFQFFYMMSFSLNAGEHSDPEPGSRRARGFQ
jgi:hypothetical protein